MMDRSIKGAARPAQGRAASQVADHAEIPTKE